MNQTELKNKLINLLQTEGKTDSWLNLYEKYPFKGTNLTKKQKSDSARRLAKHCKKNRLPKILIFDIETAPLKAWVWRLWKQNVHPTNGQLQSEYFMLTWSAKWLFNNNVMSEKLTRKEVLAEDDYRLTLKMWELFNEADIVIAHYGLGFDVKVLNSRFIKSGLPCPTPYQVIDTKLHAQKHFMFESNKLDYLGKVFNIGRKVDTGGFDLWERCMNGDETALKEMETYNIQDVILLEELYLLMRPYIKPHPNVNLFIQDNVERCPVCSSKDLDWNGNYVTSANMFKSFRCKSCGSIGRSRSSILTKEFKKTLTLATAR